MADSGAKTVLVLGGGGGLAGLAHVGVVRALEQLELGVDEIVATSLGSVVGAAYAGGLDADGLEQLAVQDLLRDTFRPPAGAAAEEVLGPAARGAAFRAFLNERLPSHDFARLARPFFCAGVSATSGRRRTFGLPGATTASVPDAVYASATLPGAVEPVEVEGDYHLDGAFADPLVLNCAEARAPDLILAVDLSQRDHSAPVPFDPSVPHLWQQAFAAMASALHEHGLHRHARNRHLVLIKPQLDGLRWDSAAAVREGIRRAQAAAVRTLANHAQTRYLCAPEVIARLAHQGDEPTDYVELDVDMDRCVHCGLCATTCVTKGYAAVPWGNVVRKLHHYTCTRDLACERACPTGAIRLRNV